MATNPQINASDPTVARQLQRQTDAALAPITSPATVTGPNASTPTSGGAVRTAAPVIAGNDTILPQTTAAVAVGASANTVTLTTSANNESGDVTTVYSTKGSITVNPVNQTINQYTSVDSGVSQIVAGTGVTITATGDNGTGVVTINSSTVALGNIVSVNLDGNSANVLHGDGTWSADQTTYSNSNVASYLPTYTGNVGAGNVNVTGTVYSNGISSTGLASLTTLTVGASANLGAVGNVIITGGTSGQKLTTNGNGVLSWTDDANSSYGNSNVVTLLSAFGSNTITTTGNVSVGNIIGNGQALTNIAGANVSGFVPNANVANTAFAVAAANVSGLGNIATINLDGSSSNVLYGNGAFAPVTGGGLPLSNGNSIINIASVDGNITLDANGNIFTFGTDGNLTTPSNLVIGPGLGGGSSVLQYNDILQIVGEGANGAIVMGWAANQSTPDSIAVIGMNTPYANGAANLLLAVGNNATTVNYWNFDNTGNLTLPGNTFAVNYANGTQVSIGGGANTGNVTFSNVTVQGDNNALNLSAGADFTANLAYLQVRAGDVASHIHFDTGNSQAYDLFVGNDDKYVQVSSTGNIIMSSYDGNTSYIMTLDNTGDLILAGGSSIIRSVANSSLDPVNPNVSTMTFIPDAGYTSQSLVLDPTSPGHIHLRSPGTTIEEPLANIFLGGENSSFEVGYYNGSAPNVFIHSGGNTWTFGNDGTTTFPTGNITSGTSLQFTTTFANVKTVEYQTAGVWDLYVEDSITGSNTAASRLNVSFKDNLIDKPQVYIENTKESDGIALRWTFDENGNLNFPRDVAGNTDPFLTISGGANPRILSEDVGLAGPANLEITALNTIFTGSSGSAIKIYPDDGEVASDGNLQIWSNAVGNTQYSWTFDDTGNLTTPGSILPSTANTFDIGNGSNYFRDSYFSGNVNADAFTTSDGGLTHSGSAVGINANAGKDIYLYADAANVGWTFDSAGNLTLPGNTVAINFANGSAAFGNIVATNLDSNVSNVLTGNGTFVALPVINANTVVWSTAPVANTSAGTAGEAAYDAGGNLYVCVSTNTWAKFTGTTSW